MSDLVHSSGALRLEPEAAGQERCRKCGGAMAAGIATGQTVYCGREGTCSPAGPGYVMGCLKCSACGWSVTAGAGEVKP